MNLGTEGLVCGTCQPDTQIFFVTTRMLTRHSVNCTLMSLFSQSHTCHAVLCVQKAVKWQQTFHMCLGGQGDWLFSKGHLMRHPLYRHYTVCCSPVLHQSHYGGTQRSGRARLTLQHTQGLCYLEWQVGQRWKWTLAPDAWLPPPPSSNPHTSESYSTAGGLNMTVRHRGSCVQFAFHQFERNSFC